MNENYLQGFIQKCAEAGVDPEALLKTAGMPSNLLQQLMALLSFKQFRGGWNPLYKGMGEAMSTPDAAARRAMVEALQAPAAEARRGLAKSLGAYAGLGLGGAGAMYGAGKLAE